MKINLFESDDERSNSSFNQFLSIVNTSNYQNDLIDDHIFNKENQNINNYLIQNENRVENILNNNINFIFYIILILK